MVVDEVACAVPQAVEQLLPGQDLTGMVSEKLEQLVFVGGDDQLLLPPLRGQSGKIQHQRAVGPAVRGRGGLLPHAPQGNFQPLEQNLHVEGLGHIVLGSHVKAGQHVLFQVVGGQKDDRQLRPLRL